MQESTKTKTCSFRPASFAGWRDACDQDYLPRILQVSWSPRLSTPSAGTPRSSRELRADAGEHQLWVFFNNLRPNILRKLQVRCKLLLFLFRPHPTPFFKRRRKLERLDFSAVVRQIIDARNCREFANCYGMLFLRILDDRVDIRLGCICGKVACLSSIESKQQTRYRHPSRTGILPTTMATCYTAMTLIPNILTQKCKSGKNCREI
jgi:hypothetical protein